MSRYSAFDKVTGAWGEIVWLLRPVHLHPPVVRYLVKVGERTVGEIWFLHKGWTAISYAEKGELRGLRGVDGFRTRWAATEYLLEVGVRPLRKDEEDES